MVNEQGIFMDPAKVKAITEIPIPKNVKKKNHTQFIVTQAVMQWVLF